MDGRLPPKHRRTKWRAFAPTPNPSPRAREGLQERLPVSLPDLIDSGGEMRFC